MSQANATSRTVRTWVTALIAMTMAWLPVQAAAQAPADIPAMTLKVADFLPAVGFASEVKKWWANEITTRTGGKVKLQIFWAQSLLKGEDMVTGLAAGVADLAMVLSTYDPARTPVWMTLDMPFNLTDYWCGISVSRIVAEEDPALRAEFGKNGFKPVIGYNSGHFHFLSKEPILKISDLADKRFRSYGGARVRWMGELKMAPVFMNYNQIYESVERGVLDGAEATIYLTEAFKHYEVAKHLTIATAGAVVGAPLSINLRVWNSFPESLRQIFLEVGREHDMRYAKGLMELEEQLLKKFQEKNGMKIHRLSAEDRTALEASGRAAQEKWLSEMDTKGVSVRKTWERFQDLQRTCEKEVAANGYPWRRR